MIKSILVPLDGSDFAEHALPLAASLARRAGATLYLARVHLPAPPTMVAGISTLDVLDLHVRQDEQAYLADVARRLNDSGARVPVKTALLFGEVCEALKGYAARIGIGLAVMATHGRGPLGRFFLGSVADDLAAALAAPLLLVHPAEGKPDLERDIALKNVVLPLDGTDLAEKALEPALELGKLFDSEFTLVRVNKPALLEAYAPDGAIAFGVTAGLEQATEIEHRQAEEARGYLANVAEKLADRGFRVRTHVLVEERPADGILAGARTDHADMIAMETHCRRGLSRLFLGSVADDVVREGEAAVLVHHTAG